MKRLKPEDLARGSLGDADLNEGMDEDSPDMGRGLGLVLAITIIVGSALISWAAAPYVASYLIDLQVGEQP